MKNQEQNDSCQAGGEEYEIYGNAVRLSDRLPFISCVILQKNLGISYEVAAKLLCKLKAAGHTVLEEKDLIAQPIIKIVFVNNTGTESIRAIIQKCHPNIELIEIVS